MAEDADVDGRGMGSAGVEGEAGDVLDTAVVEELRWVFGQAEPGAVTQLLEDFIAGARERVEGLATAAASQDVEALTRLGHSLRGSSANFGAHLVARTCWRIEEAAGEQGVAMPELQGMIEQLRHDVDRAAVALRVTFETGDPAG